MRADTSFSGVAACRHMFVWSAIRGAGPDANLLVGLDGCVPVTIIVDRDSGRQSCWPGVMVTGGALVAGASTVARWSFVGP